MKNLFRLGVVAIGLYGAAACIYAAMCVVEDVLEQQDSRKCSTQDK